MALLEVMKSPLSSMFAALSMIAIVAPLTCAHASVGEVGEEVKSALFKDCGEAKRVIRDLAPSEEEDTYTYFVRVLSLNTEAPDVAEAFLPAPNTGHAGGLSWQSVDARRELAAKRCALDLLESAGDRAFPVLVELATVYSEQQLSDELSIRIEEVSADIAERAHLAGRSLSRTDVQTLVRHLSDSHPLVAKNLLSEFFDVSGTELVRFLLGAESSDKAGIAIGPLLREIDPSRFESTKSFLEIAPLIGDLEIKRAIIRVPLPDPDLLVEPYKIESEEDYRSSVCVSDDKRGPAPDSVSSRHTRWNEGLESELTTVVDQLALLSANPAPYLSIPFGRLLGQSCLSIGSVSLPPAIAASLAERAYLSLLSRNSMPLEAQKCLVRSVPDLKVGVRAKLLYGDPEEKIQGLELLEPSLPHFVGRDRMTIFARLREISSEESEAGLRALALMTLFPERTEEVTRLYFQRAKLARGNDEKAKAIRRSLLIGLSRPSFVTAVGKFASILFDWLEEGTDAQAVEEIVQGQVEVFESNLVTMWRKGGNDSRARILELLQQSDEPLSPRILKQISEGYFVPELRAGVEAILRRAATTSAKELNKLRRDFSGNNRFDTLRRLTEYRIATSRETVEFVALLDKANCANLSAADFAIDRLLSDDTLPLASKATLYPRLSACLPEVDGVVGLRWANSVPLSYFNPAELQKTAIPVWTSFAPVLASLIDSAVANQENGWFAVIDRALTEGDRANQTVVLKALPRVKGDLPSSTVSAVTGLISKLKDGDENFSRAILILASLKNANYDWAAFVRGLIAASGEGQTPKNLAVVQMLSPQIVINEVSAAIESEDPATILGATRVGALLGKRGFALVPSLWELRNNDSPMVRNAAVLALLEVNPLTPDLHGYVARLLVNRYFPLAVDRPIMWDETAAVAVLTKRPLGFLRTSRLQRLSQKANVRDATPSLGRGPNSEK